MPVLNSINDLKQDMTEWRRSLHQNPQTAYEETFASGLVKEKLTEWGIPFKDGIAVTGVVATIEGQKNTSGKRIALRADMDALDITEATNLPYASKNDGKMHACGHDGHTATLLGTAKYLNDTKNFDGTVHLIFQPAEEGECGAVKMIEEGFFKDFDSDYVFALHNWPGLEYGKIGTRVGPLVASVDEFKIEITGAGGHAAMPHETKDPVITATQLISAIQSIVSRNVNPIDTAVVSVTNLNTGTGAFNVIPEKATLTGTVRTFNDDVRHMIKNRIETLCKNIGDAFGSEIDLHYNFQINATINTADGVEMAARAAEKVVGADHVDTDFPPTMGGEDFGAFLAERPGAFFIVGQGLPDDPDSAHNQGLHTPRYDFNDDILPIGASAFAAIVEDYMPLSK